jgi:hypothetical protein
MRAPARFRRWLPALLLCVCLAAPATARAESRRDYPYPADQVWPALVRFLRVDEHAKVVEKDSDSGYVLFEIVDAKKTYNASAELTRLKDVTRVTIKIADRPSYMEQGMLDRLARKLHDELPSPVPPSEKHDDDH